MRNFIIYTSHLIIIKVIKSRSMRLVGYENVYILIRKPEGKAIWEPRHRWENNTEMDLKNRI
jgi:hypothetical protein